ncbi:MAG TPA: hypothetical protein VF456_13315, partial [Vicinamibacterales bacterium]
NAFEVSATCGGSVVNTSGTQSGTHTATQHDTIRGTGAGTTELEFVNGILMNKNAITNGPGADRGTYVGTIRTNGSSQVDMIFGGPGSAGGESTILGIWNMYNRRTASLVNFDNTDTWNYTTASYRVKNGNVNNRIQFLVGYQGDGFDALNSIVVVNTSAFIDELAAIGLNRSTAPVAGSATGYVQNPGASVRGGAVATFRGMAPLGFNYVAPLEYSTASGTTTWYGDNGGTLQLSSFEMTTTF